MKKIVLSVIVLMVVFVFGFPLLAANKAEVAIKDVVENVNVKGAGQYESTWQYYNKGWFSTKARLNTTLLDPEIKAILNVDDDWSWPLDLTIYHGPVMWSDGLKLGWFSGSAVLPVEQDAWIKDHIQVEGEGEFSKLNVHMNYLGNTKIANSSLPFSYEGENGRIQLSASSGNGVMSRQGRLSYKSSLDVISFADETANADLQKLEILLDMDFSKRVGKHVIPGTMEYSIQKMKLVKDSAVVFDVAGVKTVFDGSLSEDGAVSNSKMLFTLESIQLPDESISDIRFEMHFLNLGTQFINDMSDLGSAYEADDPMLFMQIAGLFMEEAIPFGPEIQIKKSGFKTQDGQFILDGAFAISPEAAQVANNPFALISFITVSANYQADKALAAKIVRYSIENTDEGEFEGLSEAERNAVVDNQAQMRLDTLVIQGILKDNGASYSSEILFKDGQATINGQAMPMPF